MAVSSHEVNWHALSHRRVVAGTWWPPQEVPPPLQYWPTIKELKLPLIQIRVVLAPLQVTPSAVRAVNSNVSDVTGSDTSGCFKGAYNQLNFLSLWWKAIPIKLRKRFFLFFFFLVQGAYLLETAPVAFSGTRHLSPGNNREGFDLSQH